jgi:signal transduction histidine kinase/ActR/RegA family two-component response regulator
VTFPKITFPRIGVPLRRLSMLVLVGLAGSSVALSLVVGSVVRDERSRLLAERTKEAGALIATLFSGVQSSLPILAAATHPEVGSTGLFEAIAKPFVGRGATAIGVLQVSGGGVSAVAVVGDGPSAGAMVGGARAVLAKRAAATQGMVSDVLPAPQGRRLTFAIPVGGIVIYEDVAIAATPVSATGADQPFAELDGAVYASSGPDPATLVLSNTGRLPLSGTVVRLPVKVGADEWLLVTRPHGPLVGSFTAQAPWGVLGAGLLAAVLTAILVETLARRRSYALALVEERTVALRQATQAAEAANHSKSDFLSRMSHELRTPLNAVLGFAQLLELDELTESQQESVGSIVKGGRHLLNLINEVLDISRIETGSLPFSLEPVHVTELIGDTLTLMRPLADHRRIEVTDSLGPAGDRYVIADRQRLKQILLNLVANAIKYNHGGGTVTVSCDAGDDEQLLITVADTGPGIPAEYLDRLFVPFERLGAERGEVEGAGVGLALSLRLAEGMGGTIGVDSVVGQGSRFWVQLPFTEDPLDQPDRSQRADPDYHEAPTETFAARRKILYIEDNPSNVRLVERLLARRGDVEVISAMQGRIGFALAREHRPALILLDLHLPDIGGEELLRQLRDHPMTATIPVVILSADATDRQIERLLAAGADAYLTKPLDLQDLLAALNENMDTPSAAAT